MPFDLRTPAQYRPRSPRLEQFGATALEHHEHHNVMAETEGDEFWASLLVTGHD